MTSATEQTARPLDMSDYKPRPEADGLTVNELQTTIADIEGDIEFAVEFGADEFLIIMRRNDLLRYHAELNRRGGPEFVSAPKGNCVQKRILELQTWGDFVATDHGSAPFTINGLAPDSGMAAFHGRGKGGKTTLLIHASRAIATGAPFLDRATVQKPVIYLNYEMGFSYLKELLIAGGPCPDEAYILNRPEPVLQLSTIGLLMEQVGKPGVMVIDSFRGAFRLAGDAENSAGGAGLILRNIQDIAVQNKWLVILVHHSNRGSREGTDGVSGTSDWIAAPDVIWTWARPDKDKPGVFSIEGRLPPVDPLAVDLSPEKCVFVGSVEESLEDSDNKAILAALTDEAQASAAIAEAVDRPAGTVRKRLEALYANQQLSRDGGGKKGDPFLYSKIRFCTDNILGAETNFGAETRITITATNGQPGGGTYNEA